MEWCRFFDLQYQDVQREDWLVAHLSAVVARGQVAKPGEVSTADYLPRFVPPEEVQEHQPEDLAQRWKREKGYFFAATAFVPPEGTW